MKTLIFLTSLFLLGTLTYGQQIDSTNKNKLHNASFDIGAFYTPVIKNDFYGFNIDFKFYPFKKFATGINISLAERKISNSYTYSIKQPILDYNEWGWLNQYNLIQNNKIIIGINLNNGIVISRLGDNSEKERFLTKAGYTYKAKEVATNYLYLLEPGFDISYKIFSDKDISGIYLTAKAKYRFAFGDARYGNINDFSNYYFGFGISLVGFMDQNSKSKKK